MAVKFAGTMNAINRGLDATKPTKGSASGSEIGIIRICSGKPNDSATLRGMMEAH